MKFSQIKAIKINNKNRTFSACRHGLALTGNRIKRNEIQRSICRHKLALAGNRIRVCLDTFT